MWIQLRARLGYTRYAAHGSDWGNGIATRVALDDPAHVLAIHIAGCGAAPAAPAANAGNQLCSLLPNSAVNGAHNLGYQEIQTTKPQTLGQALSDSPVQQLQYFELILLAEDRRCCRQCPAARKH